MSPPAGGRGTAATSLRHGPHWFCSISTGDMTFCGLEHVGMPAVEGRLMALEMVGVSDMVCPESFSMLETGIAGLDQITYGGLPRGRTTSVTGTAGSGKTLLAMQLVVTGALRFRQPGVICTFVETPEDLAANVRSFGWSRPP